MMAARIAGERVPIVHLLCRRLNARTGNAWIARFFDCGFRGLRFLGINPGILRDERGLRRQRHHRACFLDRIHYFQQQLFLRRQVCGVFGLQDVTINLNLQSVFGKAQKSYARGRVFHFRIFDQKILDLAEHISYVIRRKVVAQANRLLTQEFVAEAQIFHDGRRHYAVWNRKQGALASPQPGGAQADVFHHAGLVVDAAGVADLDNFVEKNGNATEHVFERLLRAETQGKSADSYAGESGGHIHAQVAQHQQGHQQKNGNFGKAPDERDDGALGQHPALRQAHADARGDGSRDASEYPVKIERQKNPDQLAVIEPVKQRSADVTDEDVVRHDRDRQRDRVHLKEFLRRERRLIPGLSRPVHHECNQHRDQAAPKQGHGQQHRNRNPLPDRHEQDTVRYQCLGNLLLYFW